MRGSTRRGVRVLGWVILALGCVSPRALANDSGAKLRCTITDTAKAVIQDAQVSLKGIDRNFSATGKSDERGEYTFINVPPGAYRLTVDKDTFATSEITDVSLDLNEVRVLHVVLSPSTVHQELVIQGTSIVPQQTFLRGLVDPIRMQELPLNGRNFADLIYTQPGVQRDLRSRSFGSGHVVNGARSSANNFLVDGSDDNNAQLPSGPGLNINTSGVPVDELDEFSIISSNAQADYGRSSGGTVNIATKSGSDKLHGSLWEFLRNNALDSRSFFDAPGQKEPFKQNQFGGRLGGQFKKTYYSVAYEGFRQRQLVPLDAFVPSASFVASVNNPTWKAILQSAYPLPTQPVAPGAIAGIYHSAYNNSRDQDSGFVRLDRSFGSSHRAFLSGGVVDGNRALFGDGIAGTGSRFEQRNWHGVLADNWMITPTLYNNFHFGVNRISLGSSSDNQTPAALQAGVSRTAGPFAGQPFSASSASPNGFPSISTSTGVFSSIGTSSFLPEARGQNTFHLQDSVAWVKGKHQISAGGELRRVQINDNTQENVRPSLSIDSSTLASLTAGLVRRQQQNFYVHNNSAMHGFRNTEINLFIEDSYKPLSRLSLDYGLRYELNLPTSEVNNILSNAFVMINGKPQPCQSLPYGSGMKNVALIVPSRFGISPYCANSANFAPRAGFAWDASGDSKTVVRGAFGIFFDRVYGDVLHQFTLNAPFTVSTRLTGIPVDGTQVSSAITSTSVLAAETVDPGLKTPTTQRWHLTVSRQLSKDTLVNVGYVGANAYHLVREERPNFGDAFPDAFRPSNGISPSLMPRTAGDLANQVIAGPFNSLLNLTTRGSSQYHALQMELVKRYSNGLNLQAAYTWSHSLDTNSSDGGSVGLTTLNNLLAPFFAPGSGCSGAAGSSLSSTSMRNAVRCATGNSTLTTDQAAAIFVDRYISAADPSVDRGDSSFDVRHRFTANAVYQLPIGRHQRLFSGVRGWVDKLVSEWQVATMTETQSGQPLPILSGVDANFDGDVGDRVIATGNLAALNFAGGGVAVDSSGAARQYQCTSTAGVCTSPVNQGIGIVDPRFRLGRGAFRAPGLFNMDASVSKRFRITERSSIQFRSEFFNLLNRVNFASPESRINNPNFGVSSRQLLINNTQSRQIQFGLKLEF